MKRTIIFLITITILLIAVPLAGPAIAESTSSDLAKESKEAMAAFKTYMIDKKNDAVAYGKELLKKTDSEVDKLQSKTDEASGDAKAAYEEEIEKLTQKRKAAAQKLDQMGDASADSWDAAKKGFSGAYKDLYDAYREAVKKFK